MRKFLTAILSVLCLACLCVAAAACTGPKYYTLTYGAIKGVNLDFGEIQSGAKVRDGYVVSFTCSVDESRVTGEPTVLINGEDEYPDLEGVYSFTMSRNTEVSVSGVYAINVFDVTFDKEDWRIKYLDVQTGEELTLLEDVTSGTTVSFKLDISVYYDRESDFDVLANTTVIHDKDGVYSFNVSRKTTVKVSGLELETPFINRNDGGEGTAKKPYIIERPIDLYTLADIVNDSFFMGRYGMAYYRLDADIDMEGEQLFVIGDATTSYSVFCGDFNGNSHKIYNYYISDTIIEQSEFGDVFIPYLGLFGQVTATTSSAAKIYDLTLENFTINVNADKYNKTFAAGGVVGLGIGVNISNCSAQGEIVADADDVYYGYMGGIVGYLQSTYMTDTRRMTASVEGCSADVTLEGQSGYLYAAGGVVGYLNTYEQNTAAFVINSYSDGMIAGAINAGGVVGYMSAGGSVKNCYSLGDVNAYNPITPTQGFTDYANAYAGGIVGYAENDSVISGCFSLAETYASAYRDEFEHAGGIYGGLSAGGGENIAARGALALNCTSDAANVNKNYLTQTLGWSGDEWAFDGTYPVFKGVSGKKTATVSVKNVTGGGSVSDYKTVNLSANGYLPVSEWYRTELDEYVVNGNNRSYGYFFDKELTQKIPAGYVFGGDETVYFGFADYSAVSGVYYLQTEEKGSGIYAELKADGTLVYRDGALNLTTYYIYDGEKVTLCDCPAFEVTATVNSQETTYYTTGVGTLESGVMTIKYSVPPSGAATEYGEATLKAVKKIDGFLYGGYYGAGNAECYFYTDGTGMLAGSAITYTVSGNTITINGTTTGTINGRKITIGGTEYTAYDPFKGTWEKPATTHEEFTFDGKGAWTYEYFGYVNGEKTVLTSDGGTYVFDGTDTLTLTGGAVIAGGTQVSMDGNGFIKLTATDLTYYKPLSLVGTWRYFYNNEAIEITFNGIGGSGYGTALVSYETLTEDVEVTYDVENVSGTDYVHLYLEDEVLGLLRYDAKDNTLKGMIYSYMEDEMLYAYTVYARDVEGNVLLDSDGKPIVLNTYNDIVTFCLYDDFGGQWMSSEWGLVTFSGYGSYSMNGIIIREERNKKLTLPVSGRVTADGMSGTYKLDNSTMTGTLELDDATYQISYGDGIITVTGGVTFYLHRPDNLLGVQLRDGGGTVYTFDGGSALTGGGKVTATGGGEYRYTVSGNTIAVDGLGNITVSGDRYMLGGNALTVVNDFTGEWYIGGTLETLVIGEIGASGTAQGTYLGESKTFTRNLEKGYLTFKHGGATLCIFAMSVSGNKTELLIATTDNLLTATTITCISAGGEDGFKGKYERADGAYLLLDGLSSASSGNGTAIICDESGSREVYSYKENPFNMLLLSGTEKRYLAVSVPTDAEGAYVSGAKAYALYEPDELYSVFAKNEYGEDCRFDGLGSVYCGVKTYSYDIVRRDRFKLVFVLTLTDGQGKEYDAELDYGSSDYKLRFVDELTDITVTDGDITYTFTSAGILTKTDTSAEEAVTVNYTYVIVSVNEGTKTHTLTVTDGEKTYEGVLVCGEKGEYTLKLTETV